MANESEVRYSDQDLQEFKALIETKMAKAQEELDFTQKQIDEPTKTVLTSKGAIGTMTLPPIPIWSCSSVWLHASNGISRI